MVNAQEVIARALALSKAATDGPWHPYHIPEHMSDEWIIDSDPTFIASTHVGSERGRTDAEFIAAARTLLPALAKALGGVLAIVDDQGDQGFSDTEAMVRVYRAITAALSEVTP